MHQLRSINTNYTVLLESDQEIEDFALSENSHISEKDLSANVQTYLLAYVLTKSSDTNHDKKKVNDRSQIIERAPKRKRQEEQAGRYKYLVLILAVLIYQYFHTLLLLGFDL